MTISKITNAPSPNGVINKINEIIDGLGGGGTIVVDQTFDGTSINPQSGIAIEGELANYVETSNLGNGTITIAQDDKNQTFTTNQSANQTVNVKGLYDYYIIDVNTQGSLTVDGAIMSGFSNNDWATVSYIAPTVNEVMAIGTQFTTNSLGADQFIFSDSFNAPNFAVKINGSDDCFSVAVNGTWYSLANTEISTGETYQVRLVDWIYTDGITSIGTYLYVYSPSLNRVIYNGLVTSNVRNMYNSVFYFGSGNNGSSPLDGSIDLSQTYIEQNNIVSGGTFDNGWYVVWVGATTVIGTKADKTDLDNYVIKSGDTMTGDLTMSDSNININHSSTNPTIRGKRGDVETGDTPAEDKRLIQIAGYDKNGTILGIMQNYISTTGRSAINFAVKTGNNNWGNVTLSQDLSGNNYFSFPRCTSPATTTSTADGGKVAVVVQNYKNGNSWYRVWSDGWIEQGSLVQTTSTSYIVSFVKTFATRNYTFQITQCSSSKTDTGGIGTVTVPVLPDTDTKTVSSIKLTSVNSRWIFWYACGY